MPTLPPDPPPAGGPENPIGAPGLDALRPFGLPIERLVAAFVAAGIGLRLLRYLLRFPLWVDEAKQASNLLDRGYLELLQPLDYAQTSPYLFLWISKTVVAALGFHEYTLRLVPVLAGVASVILMRRLAGRLLTGAPLLFAVALFAVSYYPIRFAAEIKPYGTDLLAALALTALAIEWWQRPERSAPLWLLAALGPVAVMLSNPSLFVAGGIGLALAPAVWTSRRWRSRLALALFGVATLAAFALTYRAVTSIQYQHSVEVATTTEFWSRAFPPLGRPLALAGWLIEVHTGRMFGYPVGFEGGGGAPAFLCFVAGAVVLYRARRRTPLAILLAPFALALAAAALHRYPYGLSGRIAQWAVPAICLLAGLGAARLVSMLSSPRARRRLAAAGLGFLAFFGGAFALRDVVRPYMAPRDRSARDFARWFWVEKARDAELVCAWNDLGLDFASEREWYVWGNAQYWVNQRIYSPRHARGEPPRLGRVSAGHPLRVVLLESALRHPAGGYDAWLETMRGRYRLAASERHRPARYKEGEPEETVVMLEFVPKAGVPVTAPRPEE